jgi:hypothetical protein
MIFQKDWPAAFRPWQHCVIFLIGCLVWITRRPDAVINPQFWAEDGHVWFADAYNLGLWTTLFRAQDGYFQTLPRLAAALALLVPIALAPLVLNLVAIAIEVIPVSILLSARSSAWGSLRYRSAMAAMYLALPNLREIGAIVTSSQWIIALSVFLILVASPPRGIAGRAFDISLLLICGLTGPFCVFLLPISILIAWRGRDLWRWACVGILAALCLVESWGLLVIDRSGRAHAPLGPSLSLFARILGGQVFMGTLLGGNGLASIKGSSIFILLLGAAIVGITICAICFFRSTLEMKLLLLLTIALLAGAFLSPAAYPPPGVTRWELLAGASGIRYWFFPTLSFAWSLLWGVQSENRTLKTTSVVLLCLMCFGVIRDWRIAPMKDMRWADDAKRFEAAPAGTKMVFPENPEGWTITLVKR